MEQKKQYDVKLLRKYKLGNDYYGFDFEKPESYFFQEGQYCLFKFENSGLGKKNFRVFSYASSSDEDYIRLATKIEHLHSDFKELLLHMNVGEKITITLPKGRFLLDESKDAVFIAGGIGITPIYSILTSSVRNNLNRNDILIYSEYEKCYPFKDSLNELKDLEIFYVSDNDPTRKQVEDVVREVENTVTYYISGSYGFVTAMMNLLEEMGISKDNIKHDSFTGYED